MNAQQLKNSILQEAIEGRLVPQDPNDEPASVLLDKIRKEKARLVKEKKIALSKPEKACIIKEEGEFPLPKNWEWGMINDVCRVFGRIGFRGYTKDDLRSTKENAAISISPSNMVNGTMDFSSCTYISEEKYEESPEIKIQDGDILIVKTGSSYGKTSLVENLPWKSTINPQIAVIKNVKIDKLFLVYFFQSPFAQSKFKDFVLGTSIPTFSQLNLISMQIPLPPLAEQHRIVAKIEELMPKVEEYGKAQEALDKLNEELPERLKKSILQEAFEGRLVPQDPNDEPASVLFDKIRKEKAKLVKEGKLKKKDLEEAPISEDEIPFEIPKSWVWCRLSTVLNILDSQRKPVTKGDREAGIYPYCGANGILDYVKDFIFDGKFILVGEDGSVVTKYGNPVVNKIEGKIWVNNHAHILQEFGFLGYQEYMYYALMNTDISMFIHGFMPKYSQGDLRKTLIPLPPLVEQKRIVEKIEQLFQELDKLKV